MIMHQVLIELGADVNATTDKGLTVLHMAAKAGDLPLIRLLAENRAHLEAQSAVGNTAVRTLIQTLWKVPSENAQG